eukprot:gene26784-32363_t
MRIGVGCLAEVKSLIDEGFKPFVEVQVHRSIDGCTLLCCSSAMAVFRSSVLAAAAMCDDGLQGVLAYLNGSFAWGIKFETHLCCMLRSPEQLDCGAMTGVAILALQMFLEDVQQGTPRSAYADLRVANVEMVMLEDSSNSNITIQKIESRFGDSAKDYCRWIRNSVVYHQCVGLFSMQTGHLVVWDYGKWHVYLNGTQVRQHGIIAIKVNPVSAENSPSEVFWCGRARLQCHKWNILGDNSSTNANFDYSQEVRCDAPFSPTTTTRSSSPGLSDSEGKDHELVVFISGCHMSVNPMTGVGLARSLRTWFSDSPQLFSRLVLVGVDDATSDPLCGLVDPVFDAVRSMMVYGKLRSRDAIPFSEALPLVSNKPNGREVEDEEFWQAVISMLLEPVDSSRCQQNAECFFLPCTDRDVAFFAAKKSALRRCLENPQITCTLDKHMLKRCQRACERILCPDQETVALVEKPLIRGAMELGCFEVPEFLEVDPSLPLAELLEMVCAFCDRISYPVLVKAAVNGAAMCGSWGSVAYLLTSFLTKYEKNKSAGNTQQQTGFFVQKVVRGVDKTIAFAAYQGELTGCMLMTKTNVTLDGKVWSAHVESVSPAVAQELAAFVSRHNWTGGGEIEFVESLPAALQGLQKKWFIIDFNPRFPAWIHGGSFSGVNLPGDLLEHALRVRRTKTTTKNTMAEAANWSYSRYLVITPTAFSRSVVEQPVANVDMGQRAYLPGHGAVSMKSTRGDVEEKEAIEKLQKQQQKRRQASRDDAEESNVDDRTTVVTASNSDDLSSDQDAHRWWLDLVAAGDQVLRSHSNDNREVLGTGLKTPSYILSAPMLRGALQRHGAVVQRAVTAAKSSASMLRAQMCLSVKTQPHSALLDVARQEGYWAECISLAEVRAALKAGYLPNQVVLTGPGKFWEAYERDERGVYEQLCGKAAGLRLGGIYADSVADLQRILQRLADPTDFLRADTVGVRFQPLCAAAASRFGVDGSDPQVLRALAALVREKLPKDVQLGAHFHFAASAPGTGQAKWLGIAKAVASLAAEFAALCDRPLDVMDFGGGWYPHAFDSPAMEAELSMLMTHCAQKQQQQQLTVMFELGKSVSERGGAVICRVLEVRELALDKSSRVSDDSIANELRVKSRALIVDTTIAEVSVPHMHPLFWRSATDNGETWQMLSRVGRDEVWGRTCMEFDVLVGGTNGWGASGGSCGLGVAGICIPEELRAGDFLLVCGCGAYDMSMQYDFGDGQGRKNCVVAV